MLETSINLNQFRPFTILLVPLPGKKKANTNIINRSALITYDPNIEKKQLRIFLAHEFAHIIIKEFCSKRLLMNVENSATLFAFFAILDKDNFYKNEAKKLTHNSDIELLDDVVFLIANF